MRLINKKNFLSIVCISFTLIVLVKLIWEKVTGFFDVNYTENIFVCLGISVLITVVLRTLDLPPLKNSLLGLLLWAITSKLTHPGAL